MVTAQLVGGAKYYISDEPILAAVSILIPTGQKDAGCVCSGGRTIAKPPNDMYSGETRPAESDFAIFGVEIRNRNSGISWY